MTPRRSTRLRAGRTGRDLLQAAAQRLGWSGRGLHRVLKVARTIADLAGDEEIGAVHIAEAMQRRRSLSDAMS